MSAYREFYRDRPVLITGGLGFIGSNLAHQLVSLGARVLIVDSLIPEYGGNLFNVHGIENRVRVNIADIRQQTTMNYLVQGQDVILTWRDRSVTSTAWRSRTPISRSTAAAS